MLYTYSIYVYNILFIFDLKFSNSFPFFLNKPAILPIIIIHMYINIYRYTGFIRTIDLIYYIYIGTYLYNIIVGIFYFSIINIYRDPPLRRTHTHYKKRARLCASLNRIRVLRTQLFY